MIFFRLGRSTENLPSKVLWIMALCRVVFGEAISA